MKRVKLFLLSVLFLLLQLTSCKKENNTITKSVIKGIEGVRIDSVLTPYLVKLRNETDNEAGLAVGIIKNNELIYGRTFGYSNIERLIEVNFNTKFHIASVTKPFSAIAIAKLIQDGKLTLQTKIVDIIPEFKMLSPDYRNITVKHILTHTSGIPQNISPNDWTKPSFGPTALEENLIAVQKHTLDFTPGTQFSYSNSAFDILGIVISRASNMSFSQFIESNILQPLDMTESTFLKPKDSLPLNYAVAYSYGIETAVWKPYPYNEKLYPSSGLLTTLNDMTKWANFHLNKGTVGNTQILEPKYFELIIQPHFNTPWGDRIGLSWFLQSYLDKPIIMHTGQDTGFESVMYVYPKDTTAIIVMANRDFSRTARIVNAASEVLYGHEPKKYEVSAKYAFAKAYKEKGIAKATDIWKKLEKDTLDTYYTDIDDILTTGAILENSGDWQGTKDILEAYNSYNSQSTYSWRLLGNAHLNLGDTLKAVACYQKCLKINPNYDKAKVAIEGLKRN